MSTVGTEDLLIYVTVIANRCTKLHLLVFACPPLPLPHRFFSATSCSPPFNLKAKAHRARLSAVQCSPHGPFPEATTPPTMPAVVENALPYPVTRNPMSSECLMAMAKECEDIQGAVTRQR